jgi:hypothetical protein
MATRRALSVEIASGPADGTAVCLGESSFSVGTSADADVKLTPGEDAPDVARFKYRLDGERMSLTADADFEHDGSTTRELADAELPVQIRLGSTDLYFFNAEQTESD